jgi:hypothetical protein
VLGQQLAPVSGGLERLVPAVELGRLLRPADGQVDLADLLEGPGSVLEPRGDLPVAGVAADDGVDVAVKNS